MTRGLADAMLVLSLLFVLPVPDPRWPVRLLLHTALLAACLATAVLTGRTPVPGCCLIGLSAAVVGIAVYASVGRGWAATATASISPAVWLIVGLLLVWLAIRLLPDQGPADPRLHRSLAGIPAVALGILLTGLLSALAARGRRARGGALLLGGNGLLLAACLLPGMGVTAVASLLLIDCGLFWLLLRPSAVDETSAAVPAP